MDVSAVIVAAGRGSRATSHGPAPKQYAQIGGRAVLSHAISAFADAPEITHIAVVVHQADHQIYADTLARDGAPDKLLAPISGGATRQESVLAGLNHLARHGAPDAVLIHDGARPFVTGDVITRVTEALKTRSAAIAALPLADTLQRADPGGKIKETLDREGLWRAQTPQGFVFDQIVHAHQKAARAGRSDFTDDAAVFTWAGGGVHLVEGSEQNHKMTTAEDLATADYLASQKATKTVTQPSPRTHVRTGSGFDVHRAVQGNHVWLCGIKVPAPFSLSGHSDADVALHAVTDALYGALGDGDIGSHFPPSDPQWKGAPSHIFLAHAVDKVRLRGGSISNVDITIICETPKVGPHRDPMRHEVARILGLPIDRVSVKATTTEGLGFAGRGEGIAAMASATLEITDAQ